MPKFKVHTNIVEIFTRPDFWKRIKNKEIFGSFNNPALEFSKDKISHFVTNALISDDQEIMFEVETLNNEIGQELTDEFDENQFLAKIVARLSNIVVNGKLKVHDIKYVHIVRLDNSNESSDIEADQGS